MAACDPGVVLPPKHALHRRPYSSELIERVRSLLQDRSDREVAAVLNQEGRLSVTGRPFTQSMVRWIRTAYAIEAPDERGVHEFTVKEVAEKLGIRRNAVYSWIKQGHVASRRRTRGSSPSAVTLNEGDRPDFGHDRRGKASDLHRGA